MDTARVLWLLDLVNTTICYSFRSDMMLFRIHELLQSLLIGKPVVPRACRPSCPGSVGLVNAVTSGAGASCSADVIQVLVMGPLVRCVGLGKRCGGSPGSNPLIRSVQSAVIVLALRATGAGRLVMTRFGVVRAVVPELGRRIRTGSQACIITRLRLIDAAHRCGGWSERP